MSQLEIKRTIQRTTKGINSFTLIVKIGNIDIVNDSTKEIISTISYISVNKDDQYNLYKYLCRYNYIVNASQIILDNRDTYAVHLSIINSTKEAKP